jgi:uncharacterized protein (DUF1697 family)
MAGKAKRKAPAAAEARADSAKRVTRSAAKAAVVATEDTRPADEEHPSPGSIAAKTSQKIVAFLRGVNVGGRVHSMKSIADALGKTGLRNVDTFLASGNVVLDAPDQTSVLEVEHRVEDALQQLFGSHIPVFARSMDEVALLGERVQRTATAVNVVLLKEKLTEDQRGVLEALSTDADELEPLDKAFVWYSATKMSESPLFKVAFDKKLGVPVTVRTVNTLRRIVKNFG